METVDVQALLSLVGEWSRGNCPVEALSDWLRENPDYSGMEVVVPVPNVMSEGLLFVAKERDDTVDGFQPASFVDRLRTLSGYEWAAVYRLPVVVGGLTVCTVYFCCGGLLAVKAVQHSK